MERAGPQGHIYIAPDSLARISCSLLFLTETQTEDSLLTSMTKKLRITVEGKAYDVTVDVLEGGVAAAPAPVAAAPVAAAAAAPAAAPAPKAAAPAPVAAGAGSVVAPLAGKVDSVDVKVGDVVAVDQNVVTLEAMKMKTYVGTHVAGTVKSISVKPGDSVDEGQVLITIG